MHLGKIENKNETYIFFQSYKIIKLFFRQSEDHQAKYQPLKFHLNQTSAAYKLILCFYFHFFVGAFLQKLFSCCSYIFNIFAIVSIQIHFSFHAYFMPYEDIFQSSIQLSRVISSRVPMQLQLQLLNGRSSVDINIVTPFSLLH